MTLKSSNTLFSRNSNGTLFLKFFLSLLFAVIILFHNFFAELGPLDDHEIVSFLGPDRDLGLSEIPVMLLQTEAGKPGISLRYRPAYYLIRLLETASWGDNPFFWYSFRVFLFGLTFFIGWYLTSHAFGEIIGLLTNLCLFSATFWADIWTRLGPAETYCAVGVALYCLAFVKLWNYKSAKSNNWWLIHTFGAVLAIGSKENFLVLFPFSIVLIYRTLCQRRFNAVSTISGIVLIAFSLFVMTAILVALKKSGTDIYSNTVAVHSRIDVLKTVLCPVQIKSYFYLLPFWVSVLSLFTFFLLIKRYPSNQAIRDILKEVIFLSVIISLLFIIWLANVIFYNGYIPREMRYAFPGVLAIYLQYIFLANLPIRISKLNSIDSKFHYFKAIAFGTVAALSILIIILFGFNGLNRITESAYNNRQSTIQFTKIVNNLVTLAKRNPDIPIIFKSNKALDYEPIHSLRRYLSFYGVNNPIALELSGWPEITGKNALDITLARELRKISDFGDSRAINDLGVNLKFRPLYSIPQNGRKILVRFDFLKIDIM